MSKKEVNPFDAKKRKQKQIRVVVLNLVIIAVFAIALYFVIINIKPEIISHEQDTFITEDVVEEIKETAVMPEEIEYIKAQQTEFFNYSFLTKSQQTIYAEILYLLQNRIDNVSVSSVNAEEIDIAYSCVLADHPELFYVEGYTSRVRKENDEISEILISGIYCINEEKSELYQRRIEAEVEIFLMGIEEKWSDYEKVKYTYEYLIQNNEYDETAQYSQNICSIFLNHESVCTGYAKATQYLLNKLGIPCTFLTGFGTNGIKHAWNMVTINGNNYYLDTTWGDSSYILTGNSMYVPEDMVPSINYDYFCITTNELNKTHTIDNVIPMPLCTATDANYYLNEGLLYESLDVDKLKAMFDKSYENNDMYVTMKASNTGAYNELYDYLINDKNIFTYVRNGKNVTYAVNETELTITVWLQLTTLEN